MYEGKGAAIRVELYRFQKGHYSKPVYVKRVKAAYPGNFDEQRYWRTHYRELLGHH
jgi:hypothetical protein